MNLTLRTVKTLWLNDLRMLLRSRRTLVMSVVIPLVMWPLMLSLSRSTARRQEMKLETTDYTYAVVGSGASLARDLLAEIRSRRPGNDEVELSLTEVTVESPATSLEEGTLHFYLEATSAAEARDEKRRAAAGANVAPPDFEALDVPAITIFFRADRDTSRAGQERIHGELEAIARETRGALLMERGFPVSPSQVAALEVQDVASEAQSSGLRLGRFLTLFLMMLLLSGGSVVAIDSLAGEKERGTLETLLTTALRRFEIVLAKHLAILTVAVVITLLQVLNMLAYVTFELIPLPENLSLAVSPGVAGLVLLLFLPVASLVSSTLLLVSGRAKTYKEAQLHFFPVFLLGLAPTLAPLLPGVELRSAVVLVPIANVSVAVKEILVGTFDWPMIALAWGVTAGAAVLMARASARTLSTERLITTSDLDRADLERGPALFPRHVLGWFAVMWAVLLVAGNYMGTDTDIRAQLLLNFAILLAGSTLMVKRYRLPVARALSLRPVHPAAWLAVLLGVPSALVVGNGVFRLASLLFPVPERFIDRLGETLAPQDLPTWQMLLFLSVLPGVVEEMAFRGVLLHGLRRRFHPAVLPLVVGLVFGLYHVALFRILPTAFLGMILASVTLLSGSLFPAMLWHALNNALSLLIARGQVELGALETWMYLPATGLLVGAFWLLWRHRSPYPELRSWRASR